MIFVDTSFWVALRLTRDHHHAVAAELLQRHADEGLVTSSAVRGETWTYLCRRAGHASALAFLDALDASPRVSVVAVTRELDRKALLWLRRRDEREYSYVDATSFAVMRRHRLRQALAFDGDFSAAGFVELR